jgi:hypothetical protein
MIQAADYEHPHTFAEAVQYLAEGHAIDYEVQIDCHRGALLTRESWLEAVREHFFMDEDGMGNQVDKDGAVIKTGTMGGWVRPSEADTLVPECTYILWYNK